MRSVVIRVSMVVNESLTTKMSPNLDILNKEHIWT